MKANILLFLFLFFAQIKVFTQFNSDSVYNKDSQPEKQKNFILKTDVLWAAIGIGNSTFRQKFGFEIPFGFCSLKYLDVLSIVHLQNCFSLGMEYTTFKNQSIQLSGYYNYYSENNTTGNLNGWSFKSESIEKAMILFSQYRFYIASKKRLYVSPYFKYSLVNGRSSNLDLNYGNVIGGGKSSFLFQEDAFGGLTGFQFFIKERISVDCYAGLHLPLYISLNSHYKRLNDNEELSYNDRGFIIDAMVLCSFVSFNLGYRFIHK